MVKPSPKPRPGRTARRTPNARTRILDAAYDLFSTRGVTAVGVDAIIDRAGVAKASLYQHFASKEQLVLAFLAERKRRWGDEWLVPEVMRRSSDPPGRLLAIFDAFDGWFRARSYEGCSIINVLVATTRRGPVRTAAISYSAQVRRFVHDLAAEAGLEEPEVFARAWQSLMKGAIISALEGDRGAALAGKRAGRLVLENWPRVAAGR